MRIGGFLKSVVTRRRDGDFGLSRRVETLTPLLPQPHPARHSSELKP